MKSFVLVLLVLLGVSPVFPFGAEGHRTVSAIALPLLTPATRAAIDEILEGESLLDAATWPDDIKPNNRLNRTAEARAFNRDHEGNDKWHYVNFPVTAKRYMVSSRFAGPHDVVHMINLCIAVLEGAEPSENLSKKEALRFLAHLVGDIHQPLHVVAGYYDLSDIAHPKFELDPADIPTAPNDRGGLMLDYGLGQMHSMWDTVLVNDVFDTSDPQILATEVMRNAPPPATFKTSGKYKTWAGKWATDSMKIGAIAYADIQFNTATLDDDFLKKIAVTLTPSVDAYRAKHKETVKVQLRKAGVHLAQLLNAIDWEEIQ